jgi:hypothetical protein
MFNSFSLPIGLLAQFVVKMNWTYTSILWYTVWFQQKSNTLLVSRKKRSWSTIPGLHINGLVFHGREMFECLYSIRLTCIWLIRKFWNNLIFALSILSLKYFSIRDHSIHTKIIQDQIIKERKGWFFTSWVSSIYIYIYIYIVWKRAPQRG